MDARDYGNEARFVNHSCEPNCSLQKWLVRACDACVGLWCLRGRGRGRAM